MKREPVLPPEQIQAIREEVEAKFPDVKLGYHLKDSYVDRREDMFYIHKGNAYLGSVNAKDATAYCIITAIQFYMYAYNLATERAEDRVIDKLCTTFNLERRENQ